MGAGRDERGVVAVLVAIMMVVLLGCAAISIDIGANYVVKRQLQNGADAAALAVAQESSCNTTTATSTAATLVEANVNTGSGSGSAVVDPVKRTVTAAASAVDTDGLPGRRNIFAPVLGIPRTQISASATAGCGSPLAGWVGLPIAFDKCRFTDAGIGKMILVSSTTVPARCDGGHVKAAPGAFGWLRPATGGCPALISRAIYGTPGDNGNNIPTVCKASLEAMQNKVVLVPIYDDVGDTGSGTWFHVVGFAAFTIQGYRFSGNPDYNWQNDTHGSLSCTGNCRGIIGTFSKVVTLESDATSGGVWDITTGGADFGVTVVSLLN
ncbi:pilus assembly protein TadG-related protein [Rhodococcus sp. ACT016]|uniref:TadE/TadG family type IV pilus assembly protein n=1 Tax=Rhodococcus sp. ACT016 TaxID=3134808 RepID=UPI003D27AA04